MGTYDKASPLPGNKLYQQRAAKALPILVRYAKAKQTITYNELAKMLDMSFPLNLNYPLACIAKTLYNLGEAWSTSIPMLNYLVVKADVLVPNVGKHKPIMDKIDPHYAKKSLNDQHQTFEEILQAIIEYPHDKWDEILNHLGLSRGRSKTSPYGLPAKLPNTKSPSG